MGRRLQARRGDAESRVVFRLTLTYLAVFAFVIAALSALAFWLYASNYRETLEPLLALPEGRAAFGRAMRAALGAILAIDAALLIVVGLASYALARAALQPLVLARRREERFAADAAHELRTPLGAIASVAEASRDGGPYDEAFAAIARRALEAGALVGDLLTLARSGDAEALVTEPVDLAALVNTVVKEARERSPGLTFQTQYAEAIVDGDERRLLQLARNLVGNAARCARTRVDVRVSCDANWATLSLDDDGSGVPAELEPMLFERFAKGPDSPGSGLGLAICRWVARAHGGDVTFEGGAHFVARVPCRETARTRDLS
ncbi:MAG TPA: HAMP domain-containing sensor histidine kinase [Candidatus Baltobacteraceae bacterium]|nr:HAMP domain-containing sensor histidine kinase [Candidatus Baltobacteraceae bacterium]